MREPVIVFRVRSDPQRVIAALADLVAWRGQRAKEKAAEDQSAASEEVRDAAARSSS